MFVGSFSKLKRLDAISKSPIFSHFGESLTGVTTIRAYKVQKRFSEKIALLVDNNNQYYYPNISSSRWLAIRVDFLGGLVVLFAAVFAMISRNSLSEGMAGLSVSFAFNVCNSF